MADLERQANKKFGSFGDLRLMYSIGLYEDMKDVSTAVTGLGVAVEILHEIVRKVARLNHSEINDSLSKKIRVVSAGIGIIGFLGRKYFDKSAELAATELSARSRTNPRLREDLERLRSQRERI